MMCTVNIAMHKICRKLKHLAMEYKVTYVVYTRESVKKHISLNNIMIYH